jgi:hypothetical protein
MRTTKPFSLSWLSTFAVATSASDAEKSLEAGLKEAE